MTSGPTHRTSRYGNSAGAAGRTWRRSSSTPIARHARTRRLRGAPYRRREPSRDGSVSRRNSQRVHRLNRSADGSMNRRFSRTPRNRQSEPSRCASLASADTSQLPSSMSLLYSQGLRPSHRRVVGRQSWGHHADVSLSRTRTGGKSTPHYNSLDNLTPVVFVATGGEHLIAAPVLAAPHLLSSAG